MQTGSFLLLTLIGLAAARPFADKLTQALSGLTDRQLILFQKTMGIELDDEPMMADAPILLSNDTAKSIKDSWDPISGRDKQQRLQTIREQVLRILGRNESKNGSQPNEQQAKIISIISKIKTVPQWPAADVHTELQSFYPSCEIPRNTDEEAWDKGQQMNLFFNLNFSASGKGSTVSVQWAKLKLYKLPQGNTTLALTEDTATGSLTQAVDDISDKRHYIHFPAPGGALPIEEKQIRVSVYWYTRSLRKHRVKRKLLDSQMISYYGDSWTEYNVKPAVKSWKEMGRNFGISVEVEDEDRVILPASKMFAPMNCTKEASVAQPIPSVAVESLDNNMKQVIKPLSQLFPVLELSTREFPESDVQYSGVKLTDHRLRHQHPHSSDSAQINDTMVGGFRWEDPRESDASYDR